MSLATILQKSSTVALAIIVALVTYQLALLTWSVVGQEEPEFRWQPSVTSEHQNSNEINTHALQQQHLFGKKEVKVAPKVAVKPPVRKAPKTRLNLTLVGIVAATNPKNSSVIIQDKGQQSSYFVDSKIDGTNAVITHIYSDRIILKVGGFEQTLMLDGADKLEQQQNEHKKRARSLPSKQQSTGNKTKALVVKLDRKALLKNPAQLMDYIHISPVRKNGKVLGYRVKPGKDKTLFEQAGLQSGDLAIELNGIDLTDTQQAFSLMSKFPTMTDMALTVDRDGQVHELYLSLP